MSNNGQQNMGEIAALQNRAGTALLKLTPPGRIDTPVLGEFISKWKTLEEVPHGDLKDVVTSLEADVIMREQLGDTVFFALRTIDAKKAVYRRSIIEAEKSFKSEGLTDTSTISWWDFEQRRKQMRTKAAKYVADQLQKKQAGNTRAPKRKAPAANGFKPPTLEDVQAFCKERNNNINPRQFLDYYAKNDWKDRDNNPVKNWKLKMIGSWEGKNTPAAPGCIGSGQNITPVGREVPDEDDILANLAYVPINEKRTLEGQL